MGTVQVPEAILSHILNAIARLEARQQPLDINPTSTSSVAVNNTNAVEGMSDIIGTVAVNNTNAVEDIPDIIDTDNGGTYYGLNLFQRIDIVHKHLHITPVEKRSTIQELCIKHNTSYYIIKDILYKEEMWKEAWRCRAIRLGQDPSTFTPFFRIREAGTKCLCGCKEVEEASMDVSREFDPTTAYLGRGSSAVRLKTKEERLAALPPYANPKKLDMNAKCLEYAAWVSGVDRVPIAHMYACSIAAIDAVLAPSSGIPREATFYTYLEAVKLYDTGTTLNELRVMEWPRLVSLGKAPRIALNTLDEILTPDAILKIKDTAMQMWTINYQKNNPIPEQNIVAES
jgi:hypothetical protein